MCFLLLILAPVMSVPAGDVKFHPFGNFFSQISRLVLNKVLSRKSGKLMCERLLKD